MQAQFLSGGNDIIAQAIEQSLTVAMEGIQKMAATPTEDGNKVLSPEIDAQEISIPFVGEQHRNALRRRNETG